MPSIVNEATGGVDRGAARHAETRARDALKAQDTLSTRDALKAPHSGRYSRRRNGLRATRSLTVRDAYDQSERTRAATTIPRTGKKAKSQKS